MIQVSLLRLGGARKCKCQLCDRTAVDAVIALWFEGSIVLGDLRICEDCAQILEKTLDPNCLGQKVEQQWNFNGQ